MVKGSLVNRVGERCVIFILVNYVVLVSFISNVRFIILSSLKNCMFIEERCIRHVGRITINV